MSIFKKKSNAGGNSAKLNEASELESAAASNDNNAADDKELVAVIMAAVMNCLNTASSSLKIRSIKRIGRNSPVWNTAGRDEYIASKL